MPAQPCAGMEKHFRQLGAPRWAGTYQYKMQDRYRSVACTSEFISLPLCILSLSSSCSSRPGLQGMAHWRLILVCASTTVEPCQCDEGYHECCLHGSLPVARPRATEQGDSIQRPMPLKDKGKCLSVDEPRSCILRAAYLKDT
jgi:hypothetical protein